MGGGEGGFAGSENGNETGGRDRDDSGWFAGVGGGVSEIAWCLILRLRVPGDDKLMGVVKVF